MALMHAPWQGFQMLGRRSRSAHASKGVVVALLLALTAGSCVAVFDDALVWPRGIHLRSAGGMQLSARGPQRLCTVMHMCACQAALASRG